jgi:hypothetical protein
MKNQKPSRKTKRANRGSLHAVVGRDRDKPKLSDLIAAAHAAGVKVTIGLEPKEGYTSLHPGFRHKVWYGFRDGTSTLRLRRKYSLTQSVVEQIIRDHMKAPNTVLYNSTANQK